jgi:hypothetical protein
MALQKQSAELADALEETLAGPSRPSPALAGPTAQATVSPARSLQDELHRAFSPGPIIADQFSVRRALKFIAPTWLSLWAFVTLVSHIGHH